MDLDILNQKRQRLESEAQAKINEALQGLREDLSKTNDYASQKLKEINKPDSEPEQQPSQNQQPKQPEQTKKPIIYFSYPMMSEQPAWVNTLRDILSRAGYLVYNPMDDIQSQLGQRDLPDLNAASVKIVKSLCPLLYLPEEILLPFDAVWKLLQKGDTFDNYGITFQRLWFLSRSSLMICDLMQPHSGVSLGQELLYSKQLGIPTIGLMATSGYIDPFAQRTTTTLFSGNDLISLLPLIKGYAPI